MNDFRRDLVKIKAFGFDVDGVLSGSSLVLDSSGEMLRNMNIKDSYALQYAVKKQYPVAIISGGHSDPLYKRFANLGIIDIYSRAFNKKDSLLDFAYKYHLSPENILFMGDDIPDIEALTFCGMACCPADAAEEVRQVCSYISDKQGGQGCVRDVIEQVLKLQGNWLDPQFLNW
mgnify:CR=1 FL=1